MAKSSSDSVAIPYVLPVLWMTSNGPELVTCLEEVRQVVVPDYQLDVRQPLPRSQRGSWLTGLL